MANIAPPAVVEEPVLPEEPPQQPPIPEQSRRILLILAVGIFFIVSLSLTFVILGTSKGTTGQLPLGASPSPLLSPTPTPISLLSGKGEYTVSQSRHKGPSVTHVTFDPLDAREGQTLTITMRVTDTLPVDTVIGTLSTDHKDQPLIFQRLGTDPLTGDWQTRIVLEDSLWYTYILSATASGSGGTSTVKIAPRS